MHTLNIGLLCSIHDGHELLSTNLFKNSKNKFVMDCLDCCDVTAIAEVAYTKLFFGIPEIQCIVQA